MPRRKRGSRREAVAVQKSMRSRDFRGTLPDPEQMAFNFFQQSLVKYLGTGLPPRQ